MGHYRNRENLKIYLAKESASRFSDCEMWEKEIETKTEESWLILVMTPNSFNMLFFFCWFLWWTLNSRSKCWCWGHQEMQSIRVSIELLRLPPLNRRWKNHGNMFDGGWRVWISQKIQANPPHFEFLSQDAYVLHAMEGTSIWSCWEGLVYKVQYWIQVVVHWAWFHSLDNTIPLVSTYTWERFFLQRSGYCLPSNCLTYPRDY